MSSVDRVGNILVRAGWKDHGDAQWKQLEEALPELAAILARQPEAAGAVDDAMVERACTEGARQAGESWPLNDERKSAKLREHMRAILLAAALREQAHTAGSVEWSSVSERLRHAIEGECDGLGISEEAADSILNYIGFHPRGRIVGGREVDGVWVIEASSHSELVPNQLLVRYEDYQAALREQPTAKEMLAAIRQTDEYKAERAKIEAEIREQAIPAGATVEGRFPPAAFEEWFAAVEAGDGSIPVPQSIADGEAWHEHIGRRQIALGAWLAATESALAQAATGDGATHCDNCGCDWLDNGINPVGCPYCKPDQPPAPGESSPAWQDGEPVNLEAAALDALVWLELVRTRFAESPLVRGNLPELAGCIDALHRLNPTPPGDDAAGGSA